MATDTNHPEDNWAEFRHHLVRLLELTEAQTDILRTLLEVGDTADVRDFIRKIEQDNA